MALTTPFDKRPRPVWQVPDGISTVWPGPHESHFSIFHKNLIREKLIFFNALIMRYKNKNLITPQEQVIGRVQYEEGNWTEDLRIPAAGSRSFDYAINISPRKRSGEAILRLTLKRDGKENTILWDLPVNVQ